jgi:hypothetical protein
MIGQDDSNWHLPNDVAAFKYHVPSKDMRHVISGTQAASRSVAVEALLLELAHPTPSVAEFAPAHSRFTELPPDIGSLAHTFDTPASQRELEMSEPHPHASQLITEISDVPLGKGGVRYEFHASNGH